MSSDGEGSAQPEGAERSDTIVRGVTLAFAAKLVGGAFTAVLTVFLARRLGVASYGVFALALSVLALVELPSDFGVAVSLPRFLAEHRGDRAVVAELVADAVRLKAIGSIAVAAALTALAGPIASLYHAPGLAWPLRALALALVGQNFMFLSLSVFGGLRRQSLALTTSLLESATELTATLLLVALAGGATAAAFGRAIGYLVGAAGGFVLVIRWLGGGVIPRSLRVGRHGGRIASYAGAVFIVDGAFTLFNQIDALLIGGILSPAAVGLFQAPLRLVTMLMYPGQAVSAAVAPRLARAEDHAPDRSAFAVSVRLLLLLMAPVTAITTIWAEPLIRLTLGARYAESADVLRALAPYIFLSGLASLVSVGMNYLGAARRRIPIAVATVLINVIVDLILIPEIGIVGGAIGTDAAYLCYVPVHFLFCARLLELPLGGPLLTLLRSALAAGAMALCLAAFGVHTVSVLGAVAGGSVGVLVYGVGLVLTGEASAADLRSSRDWITRRRG